MEILEELVDLSIQEIVQPLDQLYPESPAVSIVSQSPPQSPSRIMFLLINPHGDQEHHSTWLLHCMIYLSTQKGYYQNLILERVFLLKIT